MLLEIEGEGNHFGSGFVHGVGVNEHVGVLQLAGVLIVEHVAKAEHEFKFGTELEERKVDVAAQTQFKEAVHTFKLYVFFGVSGEVEHGREAGHYVGTVVVVAFCSEDKVERRRNVNAFQVLLLADEGAVGGRFAVIEKGEVARPEVHGRRYAQRKVFVETCFAEHANGEAGAPAVLVARNECCAAVGSIFVCDDLRPHVVEFNVLKMRAYKYAEVESTEIGVGTVLYFALLRCCNERQQGCD